MQFKLQTKKTRRNAMQYLQIHCLFLCQELGMRMAYRRRQSRERHGQNMDRGRADRDKMKSRTRNTDPDKKTRGLGTAKQTLQNSTIGT